MTRRPFRTDGIRAFYPIVETAERVRWLLDLGARTVQIRNKTLMGDALRDELAEAVEAAAAVDAQLVVNDHWQLAIDLGAPFLHLGQDDLKAADRAAIDASGIGLGVSTHDPDELDEGLSWDPSYVALGPVYPTTLKVMPWAPQTPARLTDWKAAVAPLPLVAIGGLTIENARPCLDAGADAVCMVSDLLRPDADDRVAQWLALVA